MGRKFETRVIQLTDEELARQINELEATNGMTSKQFLLRYNSGELGDDRMFIRWAGLLSIAAKAGVRLPEHADA